jgi:pyrroloquinoline quinone biosynthesis protein B
VRAGEQRLLCIPGCAQMTDALKRRLAGASVVLFDDTLWRDDEMIQLDVGPKTGRRMGHMSVSGPDGIRERYSHGRSQFRACTPMRSCRAFASC